MWLEYISTRIANKEFQFIYNINYQQIMLSILHSNANIHIKNQ